MSPDGGSRNQCHGDEISSTGTIGDPACTSRDQDEKEGAGGEFELPKYTINLSQPPENRYSHLVEDFAPLLPSLPLIFRDLLAILTPEWLIPVVQLVARVFLRRVYDKEETRELRGISRATGIDMYHLVAFNVVLDSLMGCTSGGVRVEETRGGPSKMVHFRSLDWGMDPLRKIACQLNFVDHADGPVIARSVTYFGYVGVLTGVRSQLSMSLNFRPHHDSSTWTKQWKYYYHCLLVLLGQRRSISSLLRTYLLPPGNERRQIDVTDEIKQLASTAAYLIFCTPQEAFSLEKDNYAGRVKRANDFIVTANHEDEDERRPKNLEKSKESNTTASATGMNELIEGSLERKAGAVKLWEKATLRRRMGEDGSPHAINMNKVIEWMEGDVICNDTTHYAVIMDPETVAIVWSCRWK